MTPQEAAVGWLEGRKRVVLREYTDESGEVTPEEPGVLLGPDSDDETIQVMIESDVWIVQVDESHRDSEDRDGLRGGVPSAEMEWEHE